MRPTCVNVNSLIESSQLKRHLLKTDFKQIFYLPSLFVLQKAALRPIILKGVVLKLSCNFSFSLLSHRSSVLEFSYNFPLKPDILIQICVFQPKINMQVY